MLKLLDKDQCKAIRERTGLNKLQFARMLNTRRVLITKIELGSELPQAELLLLYHLVKRDPIGFTIRALEIANEVYE